VTYDPGATSVQELAGWIKKCGYHCQGESVPDHLCAPVDSGTITDDGAVPGTAPWAPAFPATASC